MAQRKISINGYNEVQPTKFDYSFATTFSEDSGRSTSGKAILSPMFTVESFSVEFKNLTQTQVSRILREIVPKTGKVAFSLYYYSPYYGTWQTKNFYVGDGSLVLRCLKEGNEAIDSISCSFVGVNPI